MPSIASINLIVNIPPQNANIKIEPDSGHAMKTVFKIDVNGALDVDQPLLYKF